MGKKDKVNRVKHLSVRLSEEEINHLHEMVENSDSRSVSDFVRSAAMGYKIKSIADHVMVGELRRLGGLQKHIFLEGGRVDPDGQYMKILHEIYKAVLKISNS